MGVWEGVLTLVGPAVVAFVFFVARGRWRERRIGQQLERLATFKPATVVCRARGDEPYPPQWAHARLVTGHDGAALRWRERNVPDILLPAGRLKVVHVRAAGGTDNVRREVDDIVFVATVDSAGAALHLLIDEESVEGVLELLDRAGPWEGPAEATVGRVSQTWRRFVSTWALVAGAGGLLFAVLIGALWVGSEPVQVRVTGPADDYDHCAVTWSDPWDGLLQDAQISCGVEQPGDTVPGLALPVPFRGEVFDTDSFPTLLMFLPVPLLVCAAVGIARRTSQLRAGRPATAGRPWSDRPDLLPALPALDRDRLDPDTVGRYVAARQARERWTPGPTKALTGEQAEQAHWWAVQPLRIVVRHEVARTAPAVILLLLAAMGGWSAWGGWLGTQGQVEVTDARPVETVATVPFLPDDLEVTFDVPSGHETAFVAHVGAEPEESVVVRYSVQDPQRARLVGPGDGTTHGMVISGLLTVGALLWVTWCLRAAALARARLHEALHHQHRQQLDYVLSADPEGEPVMLLWLPAANAPAWAVFLAEPVLGAIPVRGAVQVRGVPAEGAALLAVLPEVVLWPASPAVELDEELALILITGARL